VEKIRITEDDFYLEIGKLFMSNVKLGQVLGRVTEIAEKFGVSISSLDGVNLDIAPIESPNGHHSGNPIGKEQ
jgi:hypothetical protein